MENKLSYLLGSYYYNKVKGKCIRKRMYVETFIGKLLADMHPSFFIPKLDHVNVYTVAPSVCEDGIVVELVYASKADNQDTQNIYLSDIYAFNYYYRCTDRAENVDLRSFKYVHPYCTVYSKKDLNCADKVQELIDLIRNKNNQGKSYRKTT